jgi:hypothetical protein
MGMKFKGVLLLSFIMLSVCTLSVRAGGLVDIKRLEIGAVHDRNVLQVRVILENTTRTEFEVGNVLFTATAFDGKPTMSDSRELKETLKPGREQTIELEFTNLLQAGNYIGTVEVYTEKVNLGAIKAYFSVEPASQVLGVATFGENTKLKFLVIAFAWSFLLTSFLTYKNYSFLQLGISLKLNHLVLLAALISSLGFGFVGGYMVSERFFPQYASDGSWGMEKEGATGKLAEGEYDVNFVYEQESLKLYHKPDSQLQAAYELKEDAGLKIIDEAAGWYRVILSDGRHGWVLIEDL